MKVQKFLKQILNFIPKIFKFILKNWKLILIVLIVLLVFFSGFKIFRKITNYFDKQKRELITKNNQVLSNYYLKTLKEYEKYEKEFDKKLKDRDNRIAELSKTPDKTEKEKKYKEEIDNDTKLIKECEGKNEELITSVKELGDQLEETNNKLAKTITKPNSITPFCLLSIDRDWNIDIYPGLIYRRRLYTGYFINFNIEIGGAPKLHFNDSDNNNIINGGAGILAFSFDFRGVKR